MIGAVLISQDCAWLACSAHYTLDQISFTDCMPSWTESLCCLKIISKLLSGYLEGLNLLRSATLILAAAETVKKDHVPAKFCFSRAV